MEYLSFLGPFFTGALGGASVTGVFSWFVTNKKIKADLKANTRLEWISEVRKLTTEIISLAEETKAHNLGSSTHNAKLIDIHKKMNNLKLYFAVITKNKKEQNSYYAFPNKRNYVLFNKNGIKDMIIPNNYTLSNRNISVHQVIDELWESLNTNNTLDGKIINFRFLLSNYLKIEWDEAKSNR